MKNSMLKYLVIFTATAFCSCNYLDIVPDDTPALKDAFKNEQTAERFVYSCYSYIPPYINVKLNKSMYTDEFTPTQHWGAQYFQFMQFQQGLISSSNTVEDLWVSCYQGIRQCFLFLNNIDQVSPVSMSSEAYARKKAEWIGEVNFLIAYYHHILLKHYGPIVIIDHLIDNEAAGDDMFYPRSPYDECVERIAAMFDAAIGNLPDTRAPADYGKPTKLIVQSLKAEMYLYAASPLFNGNSEFYASFRNRDGRLLISQTPSENKWKTAMEENYKAIKMAEELGTYRLYEYNGPDAQQMTDFEKTVATQRYTMLDRWNSELIWGYTRTKEVGQGDFYQNFCTPIGFRGAETLPLGSLSPTLKPIELFYSENGIPCDEDPEYDWEHRMEIAPGDSTIRLHRRREPRFYAFVGFDRGEYEINGETVTLYLRRGEVNGVTSVSTGHLYSGYAVKKGIHPDNQASANTWSVNAYPTPLIRLGELYLNYAEAYAEYHGRLDGEAKGYFDAIRLKAGLPGIDEAFPGVATGGIDALRKVIQRERMLEFVFEGHWYYDLRRWKQAEAFFADARTGMWGLNTMGTSAQEFYTRTHLVHPMLFDRKHYLYPISQDYVNINYNLVQNPGW